MEYVVWGAAYRGKVIRETLGDDRIVAFIDSDENKIGTSYYGKPVISYDQYKEQYMEYVILIGVTYNQRIAKVLDADNMFYFGIEECPPEYMGYGYRRAENVMKDFTLNIPATVAVYGMTLYSVLVYEELTKRGYKDVVLIPHKDMSENRITGFKNYFPSIPVKSLADIDEEAILLTIYEKEINEQELNMPVIDIYDWTQYVDAYKNEKIAQMKGTHKGERCFVVATGPSLRTEDLEKLYENKEFCISMNSIFKSFPQYNWRPDIWLCVDAMGPTVYGIDNILEMDVKDIFVSDGSLDTDYSLLEKRCHIYHSIMGREALTEGGVTKDFSTKVMNGSTVTNVCIQLAIYLGFEKIYLLGVDNSYVLGQQQHFKEAAGQSSIEIKSEPVNIWKEMADCELALNERIYFNSKQYAEKNGIKIYNATRGGKLEVFERINFDSLFESEQCN